MEGGRERGLDGGGRALGRREGGEASEIHPFGCEASTLAHFVDWNATHCHLPPDALAAEQSATETTTDGEAESE